jgi:hypothetical protein
MSNRRFCFLLVATFLNIHLRVTRRLGIRKLLYFAILLGVSSLILPLSSFADSVTLGTLSYDTSIPAGPLGPGVYAADILNLTDGGDYLDSNGVLSAVTLENLVVSINGGAAQFLGNLAPGDFSLFPAILLSPSEVITSISLAGTLDTTSVLNSSGAPINLLSSFSATLDNPDGSPLVVDSSLVPITAETAPVATPEPTTLLQMGTGLLLFLILAKKRNPSTTMHAT